MESLFDNFFNSLTNEERQIANPSVKETNVKIAKETPKIDWNFDDDTEDDGMDLFANLPSELDDRIVVFEDNPDFDFDIPGPTKKASSKECSTDVEFEDDRSPGRAIADAQKREAEARMRANEYSARLAELQSRESELHRRERDLAQRESQVTSQAKKQKTRAASFGGGGRTIDL